MTQYSPYVSKDFIIEGSFLRLDDKEKAWEEIDGRMRTAVRKARQAGAVIRKVRGTKEELDAFRAFCLNPDDLPPAPLAERYHLYFAELQGTLVAGILLAEVEDKLFMLCHASTEEAKKHNLPSLLIWQTAEEFMGGRFRHIDIGASYRASLQGFFSGWRTAGYPMIMRPPELHPDIRLTPFDTQAMEVPVTADTQERTAKMLDGKFGGAPYTFFPRAMYAIFTLIKWMRAEGKISNDGEVWITTTTDTRYVSSCVTSAIEQTARWSRELTPKTQAIFAIHEFGFPHPRLRELRALADERGIPLIEDCAYGWGTVGIGKTGDYTIWSLTKAFPLQFGGYLVGKAFTPQELWHGYACSDENKRAFTEARLAHWLVRQEESFAKRRENYGLYEKIFGGVRTFFPLTDGIEPGGYGVKLESEERMKEVGAFVRRFGIEVANYWGNSAIILPTHQRMSRAHVEYVAGSVLATEREWCGIPDAPSPKHA